MTKLVSRKYVEKFDLYDITVDKRHCFKLKNDVVAHNSLFPTDVMSGGCVDGETEIITKRGLVKMKDVRVGDIVLSHDDTWNEVEHTWDPETLEIGHPERYKVTFEDGTKVICSENHKFLVEDQWVEISNLNVGQIVC